MRVDYTRLRIDHRGSLATVTLCRPEVHNAFDDVLISEITHAYTELGGMSGVRCIVMAAEGRSFCAGADLNWMRRTAAYSHEENLADAQALHRMFASIFHCPRVTLAAVHGAAIGGGAGLAAVADVAMATPEATFALSEVRLGLVPAVIGPYVLQRVATGRARGYFVTGERFTADDALRIGLVDRVVDDLPDAVSSLAAAVARSGPGAVATAKQLLRDIAGQSPDEAAETTTACIADLRVSPEGREGIRAFLEKRPPAFAEGAD